MREGSSPICPLGWGWEAPAIYWVGDVSCCCRLQSSGDACVVLVFKGLPPVSLAFMSGMQVFPRGPLHASRSGLPYGMFRGFRKPSHPESWADVCPLPGALSDTVRPWLPALAHCSHPELLSPCGQHSKEVTSSISPLSHTS